ncbi:flagellar biosynthetic protein FliO [Geobacter sp.]|uniref:flagellar biosynthetic protein FliO n=1 Tax=Geobacter sp. TaxID=46610 RepID=UPI002634C8DF|nr:flagellar biosynthetic protein FliO [Geobacter sp.]
MRPLTALAAAALLPAASALAAEQPLAGGGFSMTGVFLQMLASLALVLGIIYLFYYLSNRFFRTGGQRAAERHIRVVETRYLAPKKSLVLVEVGGEFLLLGSSGDQLNFIKQIDILEEIEVVSEEPARSPLAAVFQGKLDAVAARLAVMKQGRADATGGPLRQS